MQLNANMCLEGSCLTFVLGTRASAGCVCCKLCGPDLPGMGGKMVHLQAWSQGAGTSGFFYFTVADVLRELGVTSIEMLIFALLSGLKRLLCIYFLLLYTELEHGVREGSEGYFGGEI